VGVAIVGTLRRRPPRRGPDRGSVDNRRGQAAPTTAQLVI
jgi:hypothetical protein